MNVSFSMNCVPSKVGSLAQKCRDVMGFPDGEIFWFYFATKRLFNQGCDSNEQVLRCLSSSHT